MTWSNKQNRPYAITTLNITSQTYPSTVTSWESIDLTDSKYCISFPVIRVSREAMLNHNCSCYYLRLLTVRGLTPDRTHPNSLTPVSPRQHVATAPTVDFFKLAKTVVKLPLTFTGRDVKRGGAPSPYIKGEPLKWPDSKKRGLFIYYHIEKRPYRRENLPQSV